MNGTDDSMSLLTETILTKTGMSSKRLPSTGEGSGKGRAYPAGRTICINCGFNLSKNTKHLIRACRKNQKRFPQGMLAVQATYACTNEFETRIVLENDYTCHNKTDDRCSSL